jgi:hypothetical protein
MRFGPGFPKATEVNLILVGALDTRQSAFLGNLISHRFPYKKYTSKPCSLSKCPRRTSQCHPTFFIKVESPPSSPQRSAFAQSLPSEFHHCRPNSIESLSYRPLIDRSYVR